MPRVKYGAARHRKKVRVFREASGYRGPRKNRWRLAKEAVTRAGQNAFNDRRRRKREFRALWIIRLSAACEQRGLMYSRFINGCHLANIALNRKMLSELAIHDSAAFDAIAERVKAALEQKKAA